MIALRTSSADNNPAGASQFVGIPVPIGIQNGDLVLAAIALPAAGITVTPPSADWVLVTQTDTTQALGIAVYSHVAISEAGHWVFALSASVQATGVALVYAGAEAFQPIDATAAVLTAAANAHGVGALTASLDQEELALFLAAGTNGVYTPAGTYTAVVAHSQANSTAAAHRLPLQYAGPRAAFNVAFSAVTPGASVLIALVPSIGTVSYDDAFKRLTGALPRGAERTYDLNPGGDYYNFFQGIAANLKVFGHDLIDIIRAEVYPQLSRYKLPDWERVFGLVKTRLAVLGTIPQRQAQVVASWRAAAGVPASIPIAQIILGPILGYNPSTTPQVIEADQDALRLAHTYGFAPDYSTTGAGILSIPIQCDDGGKVAKAGATLTLIVSDPTVITAITLTSPGGVSKTWTGPWTNAPIKLYGSAFAGARINGTWTLTVNASGAITVYSTTGLFVEGLFDRSQYQIRPDEQPYQETGAAIFDWGVYADPAHLGENGTQADFGAARLALARLAQAHTVVNLLQSITPYPDTDSGINAAIPDEVIPT